MSKEQLNKWSHVDDFALSELLGVTWITVQRYKNGTRPIPLTTNKTIGLMAVIESNNPDLFAMLVSQAVVESRRMAQDHRIKVADQNRQYYLTKRAKTSEGSPVQAMTDVPNWLK
jgi:hypothetical protein